MNKLEQKRRLAKDMINFASSNKYTRADMNTYGKYKNIIDDPERSVEEINITALKYNWLMTVGKTIKENVDKDKHTDENGIKLWEKKGYESPKEMQLRLVEEQGKYSLQYPNPYYEEPY